MNRWLCIATLVAVAGSLDAAGAVYKCKDASGRIAYSEKPCPETASQERVKTEGDVREAFVQKLLAIARHGDLTDVNFIRQTLPVDFRESREGTATYYRFAAPAPFPASSGELFVPDERSQYSVVFRFRLEPDRCVSPGMVTQAFGAASNDGASMTTYRVKAEGPYTIHVQASFSPGARSCVQGFTLVTEPLPGPRRAPRNR